MYRLCQRQDQELKHFGSRLHSEKMISRPHSSAPVPGALCCRDREHLFFALKSLTRAWWDWSEWHAALAQLETEVHGNLRAPAPEGKRLLPVASFSTPRSAWLKQYGRYTYLRHWQEARRPGRGTLRRRGTCWRSTLRNRFPSTIKTVFRESVLYRVFLET